MTDQRLRDLERDAAHGDLQAQARLLLERVRVGDLTEERLRLAAYCGHEAALAVVAVERPTEHTDWVVGLEKAWPEARLVFSAALAVAGLLRWEAGFGHGVDPHHANVPRKALRKALASLQGLDRWPSQTFSIAAEATITQSDGDGSQASLAEIGAGWTTSIFLRGSESPNLATRCFASAAYTAKGRLSRPFLTSDEALRLGRDAVLRHALVGVLPELPCATSGTT